MNITARTMLKTVAATLILAVSAGMATAGHLRDIDDHARDIEREAERAERVVRDNFRNAPAPITSCLAEHLCSVAQSANRINTLCSCESNLDTVNALTCGMNREFREAEVAFAELRQWTLVCPVTVGGHCHHCSTCRVNEYHLKRLCERIDEVREELSCMTREVNQLIAARNAQLHHHHGTVAVPAPVVLPPVVTRPVPSCNNGLSLSFGRPVGPIVTPSSRFDSRFDDRRFDRDRRDEHHTSSRGRNVIDTHHGRSASNHSVTFGNRGGVGFSFSFGR